MRQAFPSLSGQIIGGLTRGVQQQIVAGQTTFKGGALFGAPALTIQQVGDQPTFQRALVQVTLTSADGASAVSHHWVDMQPGDTLSDATARATASVEMILGGIDSPEGGLTGADIEDELDNEDVINVSTRVEVVQQRSGG